MESRGRTKGAAEPVSFQPEPVKPMSAGAGEACLELGEEMRRRRRRREREREREARLHTPELRFWHRSEGGPGTGARLPGWERASAMAPPSTQEGGFFLLMEEEGGSA